MMKKRWRKMAAVTAAAAVLSAEAWTPGVVWAITPEFGRTEEEWARLRDNVLEYEEIEGLVTEYNVTVQNNQEDYRKNYSHKTMSELVNDARHEVDGMYQAAANATDDMTMITTNMQARLAEDQIQQTIDNAEDGETKRLEFKKTEKSLAAQAQTLMNNYYQLQCQLENAQNSRPLLENLVEVAQRQQSSSVGMATYSDVLTAQQNLLNADAQIISLQNQMESTRQNLIVMLGWAQNSTPEIREVPAADLSRIENMSPQADLETAWANDYTLLIDQRKEANSITDSGRQTHAASVENDRQAIAVALNSAYQAVLQAKNTYDQAIMDLDIANKDYNTAQIKQQVGVGTALETLQAQVNVMSAQTQQKLADLKLFQAMETYDWVVKGVR